MGELAVGRRHAPVLETARLVLRAHEESDLEPSFAMWADPAVTRYIGDNSSTRDRVWSRILCYSGLWSMLGFGYWAITRRQDNAFVGEVGFADFKRCVSPAFGDSPEMGWVLTPAAQGNGYAREAIDAALVWGLCHLDHRRIVCMISSQNAPSVKIATEFGFQEYARTSYGKDEVSLFERRIGAR